MGTILSTGILHSIVSGAVQSSSLLNKTFAKSAASGVSIPTQQPDNSQLSPFAQLVSTLQQLQQSNPNQYQQVTQQIASNLGSAAQAAQATGNSAAASRLSDLSTDFSTASQSGQLPSFQDLAPGMSSHSHSSGTTAANTPGNSVNQALDQLFSRFQSGGPGFLDPTTIALNTLTSAGISNSAS